MVDIDWEEVDKKVKENLTEQKKQGEKVHQEDMKRREEEKLGGLKSNGEVYQHRSKSHYDIWKSYKEGTRQHMKMYSTGFPSIDKHVPMEHEDLVVLAGVTSVGKTSLALDLANGIVNNGSKVCYISLEMAEEHILWRLMMKGGGLKFTSLKYKKFDAEEKQIVDDYSDKMEESKDNQLLFILGNTKSYSSIREEIIFQHKNNGIDCFFIDYLGLMKFDLEGQTGVGNRADELSYIAADLKYLCSTCRICIVLLAQINKVTSEIKDSSGPGLSADRIITLTKHAEEKKDSYFHNIVFNKSLGEVVIVTITKNRNEPTGKLSLALLGAPMRFMDLKNTSFKDSTIKPEDLLKK